jgi:hypothetical protein
MTVGAVVVVLVSRPLRCGRLRHVEIGQDFPKHCLQSFFKGPGTHTTLYNAEVFSRGFPYLDLENTPVHYVAHALNTKFSWTCGLAFQRTPPISAASIR